MALTTYSDLQASVASWLHRDDLTAIVPDLIALGEERLFRELRCRQMETALSGTIASGVIAVPSDYKELKFAYIDGTPIQSLQKTSAHDIYTRYPYRVSDTLPQYIARDATNFVFGPYPDSTYTVKGVYYAQPASISSSATFFAQFPSLFLFASLCEAAPFMMNDTRLSVWESKYAAALSLANGESKKEDASGAGMQVRAA
jgi:hypothetical protein